MRGLRLKAVIRGLVAAAMVFVGVKHFTDPAPFVRIVPAALPAPGALVAVSGLFEILGGAGLIAPWPRIRRAAAFGLFALFVAVFPANINDAVHHITVAGTSIPAWVPWARLPFQAVLLWIAFWFTRPDGGAGTSAAPAGGVAKAPG